MDVVMTTKPTILIYRTADTDMTYLQDLLFGMEEEGIPFTVTEASGNDAGVLADRASHESALAVGIGCTTKAVVLSYKNLPPQQFIYRLQPYKGQRESLRILGSNAARLAKGNPFKSDDRLEVAF